MQLPADFPHTRHEQYLWALSPHLLTDNEMSAAMELVDRLDRWLLVRRVRLVRGLLNAEASQAEIIDLLLRRPPAAFRRVED